MNRIILVKDSCANCPYKLIMYYPEPTFTCGKDTPKDIPINKGESLMQTPIPEWCPLPIQPTTGS